MILGQISYIDCFVFLIFLVPQLLIQVNFFKLAICILSAVPFFGMCTLFNTSDPAVKITNFTEAGTPVDENY